MLRLLEHATMSELTEAVTWALSIGATGSDVITCILLHRKEEPVALFSLDGRPHLKQVAVDRPDLGAYDTLTQKGA